MKSKNLISKPRELKNDVVKVVMVVIVIALLMTVRAIAQFLSDNKIIPAPPQAIQSTAANIVLIGTGVLLLLFSGVLIAGFFKAAVIVTGLALLALGVYNVYKLFTGKTVVNVLPDEMILKKK